MCDHRFEFFSGGERIEGSLRENEMNSLWAKTYSDGFGCITIREGECWDWNVELRSDLRHQLV
ncbi:hypothetical protein C480_16943 [Natrialba aegyptia DSM 13077]|uniref:Uncharacterized protein n=1 Tax=Natrialba aegyptia DSM 13077 TaxID=1227491 RepID=M0AVR1_9EURY|nr:hypothetical protein C480_16943 [Natrialba aegyptia DSM 13077]